MTMWTIVGANLVSAAVIGAVIFATTIPGRLEAGRLEDCEALQAKAREELKKIYIAEEAFRAEHAAYGSLKDIQRTPDGSLPYDFAVTPTSGSGAYGSPGFLAQAIGHGAMNRDEWAVTEAGRVENKSNACRKE